MSNGLKVSIEGESQKNGEAVFKELRESYHQDNIIEGEKRGRRRVTNLKKYRSRNVRRVVKQKLKLQRDE